MRIEGQSGLSSFAGWETREAPVGLSKENNKDAVLQPLGFNNEVPVSSSCGPPPLAPDHTFPGRARDFMEAITMVDLGYIRKAYAYYIEGTCTVAEGFPERKNIFPSLRILHD